MDDSGLPTELKFRDNIRYHKSLEHKERIATRILGSMIASQRYSKLTDFEIVDKAFEYAELVIKKKEHG